MNNWFEYSEKEWHHDTFMAAAFNDERDFEEYLNDEEYGSEDEFFERYSDEINDCICPIC